MNFYINKILVMCIMLLAMCYMTPSIAIANGQVPSLKKMPQTVPNREQLQKIGFISFDVSKFNFGEMSVRENEIVLDAPSSFDLNDIESSFISLFSKNGFLCNVKINSIEDDPEKSEWSVTYKTDSTFKTDCLNEYNQLPKYSKVAYVYPALDIKKVKKINPTILESDNAIIRQFVQSAIRDFTRNPRLNLENEKITITKIGEKGLTSQYFVYSFSTAGGYSLILAVNTGKVALQRIDNGVLSIRVLFDVNCDGLADAFVFDGGVPGGDYTYGYRIIFDGEKWLGGLISTPI